MASLAEGYEIDLSIVGGIVGDVVSGEHDDTFCDGVRSSLFSLAEFAFPSCFLASEERDFIPVVGVEFFSLWGDWGHGFFLVDSFIVAHLPLTPSVSSALNLSKILVLRFRCRILFFHHSSARTARRKARMIG